MANFGIDLVSTFRSHNRGLVLRDIFLFARLPTDSQIPLTRRT